VNSKLQRIRKASIDELRVRGSQAVAAFIERRGWSRRTKIVSDTGLISLLDSAMVKVRSTTELLEYFRSRTQPKFFPAFDNAEETTSAFQKRWPASTAEIIERANKIVRGSFDLLGFRDLNFGDPPDWHVEPIAEKRSPLLHWSRLDYLAAEVFGDKKIVWELNRQQYFSTLGQAYWFSRDERYAQTFTSHVTDWIGKNPPKLGINWASSLEVSFRSISWIWALYFFKLSSAITPNWFAQILKVLYLNALHLETYLSTYFSPNTHLTGEALGLFYIGTVFPEFEESARWRRTGLSILTEQLERHVQPDGVYFEQSSYYHRYTTDFYLHLKLLLEINDRPIPPNLDRKLQALLDHLMYITRPDGMTPIFGDDDGGRLVALDKKRPRDFRAALSTGAVLFDRADYKYVAKSPAEETLWLMGQNGLSRFDKLVPQEPERQSLAFESSGYHVMRDGWNTNANYLLFDCGHHGVDNCGHAHADALSFELAANGHTFLVDPGTFTYTASKEMRNWFRSSEAHNTVTINNESSSRPAGPFSWTSVANCSRTSWISRQRFDYVVASHDGYECLPNETSHVREILFLKRDYWMLRDQVSSPWQYRFKSHVHCDTSVEPLRGAPRSLRLIGDNDTAALDLISFGPRGEWIRESGWVSACYGVKEEAPTFAFAFDGDGAEELITFFLPESITVPNRRTVREIEALYGRAFEVNGEGSHDVLLLRGDAYGRKVETPRFASDFTVAWLRFENERTRNPEEFILIGGHAVELDGRVLVNSSKSIEYLYAKRVGERFAVETNEGNIDLSLPVENLDLLFSDSA
jgi:hypothetical protein